MILFNGVITFYYHWQEFPQFHFYWRWRKDKGTLDIAIIVFGHWFGVFIDHDILEGD